jgi:hypothetical protein
MTASGNTEGMPEAGLQAGAEAVPATRPGESPDAVSNEVTAELNSHRAPGEGGTEDEAKLKQEIERTREQLGATVDELAAKADVKSRLRNKIAELARPMKGQAARARSAAQASPTAERLATNSATMRQKAAALGGQARTELKSRSAPVRDATPQPVREAVAKGASTARQRPAWLAAVIPLITWFLVRRWRRKR